MDDNTVVQFRENKQNPSHSKHTTTSEGQHSDQSISPDQESRLASLLQAIPDSLRPHLRTFEPYSLLLLNLLVEQNPWYGSLVESLSEFAGENPRDKIRDHLSEAYRTFRKETFLGRLLGDFQRSSNFRVFLGASVVRMITGKELSALTHPDGNAGSNPANRGGNIPLLENQHRIKNHLQQIISLIKLKRRNSENSAEAILDQTIELLQNFVQLNKNLDSGTDPDGSCADMGTHIEENIESLRSTFRPESLETKFDVKTDSLITLKNKIVPVGLIVNELSMNALQHGYEPEETADLSISLEVEGDEAELVIQDNGKGLPEDFNWEGTYGLKLVRKLAEKQLNGTIEPTNNESGTGWVINFPLPETSTNGNR